MRKLADPKFLIVSLEIDTADSVDFADCWVVKVCSFSFFFRGSMVQVPLSE